MLIEGESAQLVPDQSLSAHVVVLGNEKGGSGKSTTALHVAIALLKAGQRVATIDLDSRQQSFTHYIDNRRLWAKRAKLDLAIPNHHHCVARGESTRIEENEASEFSGFAAAIMAVEHTHDFVVIDTPGSDSYLTRLAHSMADTLIPSTTVSSILMSWGGWIRKPMRSPETAIMRRWSATPAGSDASSMAS